MAWREWCGARAPQSGGGARGGVGSSPSATRGAYLVGVRVGVRVRVRVRVKVRVKVRISLTLTLTLTWLTLTLAL